MTDFRSLIVSIMLVSTIMIVAYMGGVYIDGNVDFVTMEVQSNSHALLSMVVTIESNA